MTTYSPKEGYSNAQGAGLSFEGLASNDFTTIPVMVMASARDWGNPDGSTHLRPYLALSYDSTTGYYKQYFSDTTNLSTVVVLAQELRDMDSLSSGTAVAAVAFFKGTFKKSVIVETSAIDWTKVQRIAIRDNV
jgi:hypothetical protein